MISDILARAWPRSGARFSAHLEIAAESKKSTLTRSANP